MRQAGTGHPAHRTRHPPVYRLSDFPSDLTWSLQDTLLLQHSWNRGDSRITHTHGGFPRPAHSVQLSGHERWASYWDPGHDTEEKSGRQRGEVT